MHLAVRVSVLAVLAGAGLAPAYASCGAATCALNTHWQAQGIAGQSGQRLDIRYEFIRQDQPRAGHENVSVGEIRRHHDEVETVNHNLVLGYDYSAGLDWGVSVQAPIVNRDHRHIHNHMGGQFDEYWAFTHLGDARVVARYSPTADTGAATDFGLLAGVKLPTGRINVSNADGDVAERTLQPGSGTTDTILGLYLSRSTSLWNRSARVFAQAQAQLPVNTHEDFRPGNQYTIDAGIVYPEIGAFSGLCQVNAVVKDHDHGREAEEIDSGGAFVWLSPGASYALSHATRLYGFVQLPLYQRVRGVQLTAGWTLSIGASIGF